MFVDEAETGEVRLYGLAGEQPFAGHPLVGVAWLLLARGFGLRTLRPPSGPVTCWRKGSAIWIRATTDAAPCWRHIQMLDAAEVDRVEGAPAGQSVVQVWGWVDEDAGIVYARTFAPGLMVAEDEACGWTSMLHCEELARPPTALHGRGSLIDLRPTPQPAVELDGHVVLDHVRLYALSARRSG